MSLLRLQVVSGTSVALKRVTEKLVRTATPRRRLSQWPLQVGHVAVAGKLSLRPGTDLKFFIDFVQEILNDIGPGSVQHRQCFLMGHTPS